MKKNSPTATLNLAPDVLILGAGIAGCPLATALTKQGLSVVLIERTPGPRRTFKGEYLQPAAVQTLKEFGFGETFQAHSSSEIQQLRFRDLDENARVTSSIVMIYPKDRPARSIEYFDMLVSFIKIARENLGDNFIQGAELTPINQGESDFIQTPRFSCKHPTLGTVQIQPRWVIGCDGRQSTVRRWMGGSTPEKNGRVVLGVKDEFIFGTQSTEASPRPEQYEVIRTKDQGTVSYFSLGGAGQRIYLSSPEPTKNQLTQMSTTFRGILNSISPVTNLTEFPERLMVSGCPANTSWFGPSARGAFLLAGDALAVTTPYGGQGMTVALEHVRHLASRFDFKNRSRSQQSVSRSTYNSFAIETYDRVNFLNFGLYYTFFSRPKIFKRSTQHILNTWERNPEIKTRVARLFGGLDTDHATLTEILALERVPFSRTAYKLMSRKIQWA